MKARWTADPEVFHITDSVTATPDAMRTLQFHSIENDKNGSRLQLFFSTEASSGIQCEFSETGSRYFIVKIHVPNKFVAQDVVARAIQYHETHAAR